jgi:catechol 2,3-dioxygenase-like lactoylglutathione lyase family enzyme
MRAGHLFEAAIYAADLDTAERFYREVLGLELVSRFEDRGMAFRCGEAVLLVFNPERTRIPHPEVPVHGATGAGHVAFLTYDHELESWRQHLEKCGIAIESEVDWPEGGRSIYFRDPAGNSVELAPPTLWRGKR